MRGVLKLPFSGQWKKQMIIKGTKKKGPEQDGWAVLVMMNLNV